MPRINRPVDISTVEKEAKRDYYDRHSPFIHCADSAKAGALLPVTVRMGTEYPHPDDPDHYIKSIQIYNGEALLAGALGGMGAKANATVTFNVLAQGAKLRLTALSFCTKHGLWESDLKEVQVVE